MSYPINIVILTGFRDPKNRICLSYPVSYPVYVHHCLSSSQTWTTTSLIHHQVDKTISTTTNPFRFRNTITPSKRTFVPPCIIYEIQNSIPLASLIYAQRDILTWCIHLPSQRIILTASSQFTQIKYPNINCYPVYRALGIKLPPPPSNSFNLSDPNSPIIIRIWVT